MQITQLEFTGTKPVQKELMDVPVGTNITLVTSTGRFSISENENGSLEIQETGHSRLVVRPKVTNGIELSAERF